MLQVKKHIRFDWLVFFLPKKHPSVFAGNWTDLDLDSTSSGAHLFFGGRVGGFPRPLLLVIHFPSVSGILRMDCSFCYGFGGCLI